jgi:hypothetical protein
MAAQQVVLVLEGRARAGVPATKEGAIRVVHAPRGGDDTIVEEVRQARAEAANVAVVTADRGLAGRVEGLGARLLGPGWLLAHLDRAEPVAREER